MASFPPATGLGPHDNSHDADRLMGFTLPVRGARGRLLRLDTTLNTILAAHSYPDPLARLLGQALVLAALLGELLRPEEGQLTLQAKGNGGPCALLVADYRAGELRGYAAPDLDRRFPDADDDTLEAMFGGGHMIVTLDQTTTSERYQGIVELGRTTLQDAARDYFSSSEQIPTIVRIAVGKNEDGRWTAGGMLIQHLARGETNAPRLHVAQDMADWDHVAALAGTVTDTELTDTSLRLDGLLWRLFHEEEVHILPTRLLERGCRCSVEHITGVLAQFPESEREQMRDDQGAIAVDCEFCSRQFRILV